jgi:hypothetical protein
VAGGDLLRGGRQERRSAQVPRQDLQPAGEGMTRPDGDANPRARLGVICLAGQQEVHLIEFGLGVFRWL